MREKVNIYEAERAVSKGRGDKVSSLYWGESEGQIIIPCGITRG